MDYQPTQDTSGGAWGDVFSGGSAWDNAGSNDTPFWDWNDDYWDVSYDDMFMSEPKSNWGFDTTADFSAGDAFASDVLGGASTAAEEPWWKKVTDSPSLMKTIGALGLGGAQLLSKNSDSKEARAEAARNRAWQEKMNALKMAHDQKMLEMKLASQEGGGGYSGPVKPAPGKADATTTAVGNMKVDWSKKK